MHDWNDEQSDMALDRLIDGALRSYCGGADRAGQRIAAHVSLEIARRATMRRRWWAASIGVPALACGLMAAIAIGSGRNAAHRVTVPRPAAADAESAHAAAPVMRAEPLQATRVLKRYARTGSRPLPKLAQFPAASPLTRQEQQLLALVRTTTPAQKRAVIDWQQQSLAPLHISALQIAPLDTEDASPSTK